LAKYIRRIKMKLHGVEVGFDSEEEWTEDIVRRRPGLTELEAKQAFSEECLMVINGILKAQQRCLDPHIPDLWELGMEDVHV